MEQTVSSTEHAEDGEDGMRNDEDMMDSSTCDSSIDSSIVAKGSSGIHKNIKREKTIVSVKHQENGHLQIDTGGRNVNKAQLTMIQNIILKKPQQINLKEDGPSKQQQINDFMAKYLKTRCLANFTVTKMRHIIPILLMELYPVQSGQYSCKVKGLWERKPKDWPEDVLFVDPNNKMKIPDGSDSKPTKPTKDILIMMLSHLVDKYLKEKHGQVPAVSQLGERDPMLSQFNYAQLCSGNTSGEATSALSLIASEDQQHESHLSSGSSHLDTSAAGLPYPMTPLSCHGDKDADLYMQFEEFCSGELHAKTPYPVMDGQFLSEKTSGQQESSGFGSGHTEHVHSLQHDLDGARVLMDAPTQDSAPFQVVDTEEVDLVKWEPVTQLMDRIDSKLRLLGKTQKVSQADLDCLRTAEDNMKRMIHRSGEEAVLIIEKAHMLESAIDIVKVCGRLTDSWRSKLTCSEDKGSNSISVENGSWPASSSYNSIDNGHCQQATESLSQHLSIESKFNLSEENEEDLASQLNIEKRPGDGQSLSLLTTMPILEVRHEVCTDQPPAFEYEWQKEYKEDDSCTMHHCVAGSQETGNAYMEGVAEFDAELLSAIDELLSSDPELSGHCSSVTSIRTQSAEQAMPSPQVCRTQSAEQAMPSPFALPIMVFHPHSEMHGSLETKSSGDVGVCQSLSKQKLFHTTGNDPVAPSLGDVGEDSRLTDQMHCSETSRSLIVPSLSAETELRMSSFRQSFPKSTLNFNLADFSLLCSTPVIKPTCVADKEKLPKAVAEAGLETADMLPMRVQYSNASPSEGEISKPFQNMSLYSRDFLRQLLTQPQLTDSTEQRKDASVLQVTSPSPSQRAESHGIFTANKRPAPIPVMVEQTWNFDEQFRGPSAKRSCQSSVRH